jgi:hypothetical protein
VANNFWTNNQLQTTTLSKFWKKIPPRKIKKKYFGKNKDVQKHSIKVTKKKVGALLSTTA